jgi:hypothetical protein
MHALAQRVAVLVCVQQHPIAQRHPPAEVLLSVPRQPTKVQLRVRDIASLASLLAPLHLLSL